MRVIALICEMDAQDVCVSHVHDFVPRLPVACIYAAGPELERLTPEGWAVSRWRCASSPRPGGK
jgi:hypothetical protein